MAPKFRLNPDELMVESFSTQELEKRKGTVYGQETEFYSQSTCEQIICGCTYPGGTCDLSCMGDPCQPTNINCQGCGGTGGACSGYETCRCDNTLDQTCCTGGQIQCSCP